MQFDELYGDTDDDLGLVVADYVPADRSVHAVLDHLAALDDDQLLDLRLTAACLGLPNEVGHADRPQPGPLAARLTAARAVCRGCRRGSRSSVAEHFGDLSKVLRATVPNLMEIDGVSAERAQAIKDALSRLTEEAILDQYV